ncbi:MAG: heme synthase [Hydrocarboniphaga sp.]|uniref:COX15/CtaA family protein n=1 Tax=Hydrocarboniphaga sp. TaxID=2033016 RepID=UPI002620C02C|nr:COX15/CtaA family protein [Hydrocarboniphaga sp.]MDB5973236.1 heme synthase [Hydrocarboniphaga sp.]
MLWFRRLNLATVALCFIVIVFGAYVRLSDAGLGCPDWPGCYGHVGVPGAQHELANAEAAFPDRPVEAHKAWKEMIHRYLATTLGLAIVALAAWSTRLKAPRKTVRVLPWVLVGLVMFQGALGMWTVTLLLKPLVVTGHLLGGLTTLSLLLWLWLSTVAPVKADAPRPLLRFSTFVLAILAAQIFLGGWTSTNYAALACPDLPTCQGRYIPETDYKTAYTLWHGLGINYEHGILDARARVTIHWTHRLGAGIVTVTTLLLALVLLRLHAPVWRRFGFAVLGVLALQVALGLAIVWFQLPLALATAHNAGAALFLACLVALNQRLRSAPSI